MEKSRIDFPSRIAFRPVIAGMLLTVALMLFLSSSIRNLFMAAGSSEPTSLEFSVWITMTAVWILSVFAGSILTTLASRSREVKDGILQGLTVWSTSYLCLGVLISARAAGYEPIVELDDISSFLVLKDFAGEFTALAVSVLGGILGTRWERCESKKKAIEETRLPVGGAVVTPT